MTLGNMPIRRKLMTIILLISGVVSLLTCAAFFAYEFFTYRHSLVAIYTIRSQIIAANSTAALAFQNEADAAEVLSALKADRQVVAAGLYDRDGKLFARYPADRPDDEFPPIPEAEGFRFERGYLIASQPVSQGATPLGTLYLRSDLTDMVDRFRLYALIVGLVMVTSFAVAYLLSRTLQKQISQPILSLAETARAISERHDYSVRAARQGDDELGRLTDAFNQMLGEIQTLNTELEQRVVERTAQLEAANKELESFSYSVSHDLRAPLRHIDGFAGLLVKADGHLVSARGRGYLAQIADSAKQMGMLIDDLLVFSRMARSDMSIGQVDLRQLADEAIQGLSAETQQRNIRWEKQTLPVLPGDRSMLRQVFVNLLANAVKYTRPRDPAVIEIGCQDESADAVVVYVRDNGVGFDMQYADKLFGVFQRLHRSEDFEGTGIGLANVRRVITRHGGRTWAEGRPDAGATFYFSLPRQRKPHL